MELIIQIILLIVGFVLLIKGADIFVDGASNIAYYFKISTVVVGLTIVAFGTSAPEAAVSITSALDGNSSLYMGNIIGSNIFNILCVIGISALISNLSVDKVIIKRDFPFTVISSIGLLLIAYVFGEINRIFGLIFLIVLIVYVYNTVKEYKKSITEEDIVEAKISVPKSIIFIIIGLVGVIVGSD